MWLLRKPIADELISTRLAKTGLPATYEVHRIGNGGQILRNLVIGDPRRPDLTVEEVRVDLAPRWGLPGLGRITLVRPRLYGSYRGGTISFGSLDKVLFTGSKEPFRLPDFDVAIEDGRGRLDSDWGPIGISIAGAGPLRDGFSGTLAAVAPGFATGDCRGTGASLYGKLVSAGEKPRFTGPVRLAGLACTDAGLALDKAAMQLDVTADRQFDGAEGEARLTTAALAIGANRMAATSTRARFAFRGGSLSARYELGAERIDTPQAALARAGVSGMLRSQDDLARIESEGEFTGSELRPGAALDSALASAEALGEDTLAQALLAKMRTALRREQAGNRLAGAFMLRTGGGQTSLVMPQAVWRGGSGEALLALSRLQATFPDAGAPRIAGNFATGGPGMPRIAGRAERGLAGGWSARMSMAEYREGASALALPELVLVQSARGALGFAGHARLSGALPGGAVRGLELPIKGDWSPGGSLAVWRGCTPVRFDSFTFASLTLDRRGLTLCPPPGGAILAATPAGARFAAGAAGLALSGSLGGTPIRIASGPLGFAVPGVISARSLAIELGPPPTASRFTVTNLTGRIAGDISARFAGADVLLAAVPLDIRGASGELRLAGGKLSVAGAAFRLEDREAGDRFAPLVAEGATLQLVNNRISAQALLREPASKREVVRSSVLHDLGTGTGSADLAFDGVRFDQQLQPDTLTPLALGVIANAEGTVRGTGRIDWNPRTVTSTGNFSTEKLDFAAAFGPVQGLSGSVAFTDLLGMVTAPAQKLKIASVNPGIEVNDGEIVFEMRPGNLLRLEGGFWPFFGGSLVLDPVQMVIGEAEDKAHDVPHGKVRRRQVHRPDGPLQHRRDRDLRWQAADGVRRGRRQDRERPAGLARAGRQRLLRRAADLPGHVADGELRVRCAQVDRLPADDHRHGRAAAGRNPHPRELRGAEPGRDRQAQFHYPADRQTADPLQRQPARAVLQAGYLGTLDLRSRLCARPAHARADRARRQIAGAGAKPGATGRSASSKRGNAMICRELTGRPGAATQRAMPIQQPLFRSGWRAARAAAMLVTAALTLSACISVQAPDKPIVIELNINIKQEVIYRLSADAASTIEQNKDIF